VNLFQTADVKVGPGSDSTADISEVIGGYHQQDRLAVAVIGHQHLVDGRCHSSVREKGK
jgi:hypothetical protein